MSAPEEPAFDAEELLARVEGDRALLAELVEIFSEESRRLMEELRRCVEADDASGVQSAAHALKGSVGSFSARAAAEAALALEGMGRDGMLTDAPAKLAELERELNRLERGLAVLP